MTRKKRKKKDPNAPKRPQSAYTLYMKEFRNKIIEDNDFSPSDIAAVGRELGRTWKALGTKQRGPYEKEAAIEYARYKKLKTAYDLTLGPPSPKPFKPPTKAAIARAEKKAILRAAKAEAKRAAKLMKKASSTSSSSSSSSASYVSNLPMLTTKASSAESVSVTRGSASIPIGTASKNSKNKIGRPKKQKEMSDSNATRKKKRNKKRRMKDVNEVRKPMTSYLCFCKVARPYLIEHFVNDSFANMGKKLGAAWKSLSMEEKYPFYAASEADRLRYLRECREADQDPMYAPSLAGLSLERWQSYCQDRDIVLLQPTTLHKHKTKLPKLEEVVIE